MTSLDAALSARLAELTGPAAREAAGEPAGGPVGEAAEPQGGSGGDTAAEVTGLRRLSGGASRETWSFDAAGRALILRRDPPADQGPGGHGAGGRTARRRRAASRCRTWSTTGTAPAPSAPPT